MTPLHKVKAAPVLHFHRAPARSIRLLEPLRHRSSSSGLFQNNYPELEIKGRWGGRMSSGQESLHGAVRWPAITMPSFKYIRLWFLAASLRHIYIDRSYTDWDAPGVQLLDARGTSVSYGMG